MLRRRTESYGYCSDEVFTPKSPRSIVSDCGKLPVSYFKADYIKQKLYRVSPSLDSVSKFI